MADLNSKATPVHSALENSDDVPVGVDLTPEQRLDREAMEGAKRAQKRIHDDEDNIPGDSIFTK